MGLLFGRDNKTVKDYGELSVMNNNVTEGKTKVRELGKQEESEIQKTRIDNILEC